MKIPVGGVAFLDSGVGGLTVLDACQKIFKGEIFYYCGDNARAPYGTLPPDLIRRYVEESFLQFEKLQVKAVVLACNTVTALCIDDLRTKYSFPIIGAEPAIVSAAKGGGEVFVLTTRATFNSLRFRELCKRVAEKYPNTRLQLYSCDGLAGAVEEHLVDVIYDFTRFLPRGSPRAVVLGCTHYIYIKERIAAFYGCEVFDGNDGIAWRLSAELLRCQGNKSGQISNSTQKSRDGRPPDEKDGKRIGIFNHFFPKKTHKKGKIQKTNKCSYIKTTKSLIIRGVASKNEVYFLGSGAAKNKEFYEQMFTF